MSPLLHWFTSPEWTQIVKALLHSLWQGALIALVLGLFMQRLAKPVSRYRCSLAALASVLATGVITWAVINSAEGRLTSPIQDQMTAGNQPSENFRTPADENTKDKIVVAVTRPPAASSMRWTAWLALVWLVGAGVMLVRTSVKVAGAEQLRRSCVPLNDARIEKLLVEARHAFGLVRQVRVGITNKLTSPAVVGVFVPMLILPLSLLTTLSQEQIRFVLLHELAHVRRGDYLANLFQFFAESLLFFNPAVWWISHQVRREREACCDALAIELSGAPADYARTLVQVAENILHPTPAAAPAFGDKHEPSSLADRVQRMLVPGYRPSLRLTWRAMLTALVLGSTLLVLSAVGTRMTVAAILTPQQRIAQIEKKMTEYGEKPGVASSSSASEINAPKVTVSGTVRMADGSALPSIKWVNLYYQRKNSSGASSARVGADGAFSTTVSPGLICASVEVPGFAPVATVPVETIGTNPMKNLDLVLSRGFDTSIEVTDLETGKPISGARLKTMFWIRDMGFGFGSGRELKTDANGTAVMTNCSDSVALSVAVNAAGYEIADQRTQKLNPGEPIQIKLQRGLPASGMVLNKADNTPLAGATVRIIYEKGRKEQNYEWTDAARVLAKTDASGRFFTSQLQRNAQYWLGVSSPGHESVLVGPVTAGANDLVVSLGPELIVRGRVIGDLKGLQMINNAYCLSRNYSQVYNNHSMGYQEWVPIKVINGEATFQFTNPIPGLVRLVGKPGFNSEREVTAPVDDWVVDLNDTQISEANKLPKREVIFRFKHPSGVPPRGMVSVTVPDSLEKNHLTAHYEEKEIKNGEVRAEITIGGNTSIEAKRMVGYWFKPDFGRYTITNGNGPMVIEIPLVPAGAIYAKAWNADGTPAGGLMFGVDELKRSPARNDSSFLGGNDDSFSGDAPRKWVSGPLPLGGTYRITGSRGNSFCVSKPITLTEENPDAEVELQFVTGKTLEGVVLDANGQPVGNADFAPYFNLTIANDNKHSFSLKSVFTDDRGRFRIENATPNVGDYFLSVNTSNMMAEHVKLDFNTQPQTIRLKRGRSLSGRLVEAGTGQVIPGAEVRASDFETFKLPMLTTRTDADGRFAFTSLGNVGYRFFVADAQNTDEKIYRADGKTNLTLAVKLYGWSKLKPKPATQTADQKLNTREIPQVTGNLDLVPTNKTRQIITHKLGSIRLESVRYDKMPLNVVFSNLAEQVKSLDPDQQGVNFIFMEDIKSLPVTIRLTSVPLRDVLNAIVNSADKPMKYSIEDYGVVFSLKSDTVPQLFIRWFKINNGFFSDLTAQAGTADTNSLQQFKLLQKYFSAAGVDLSPPKAVFYKDRDRILVVRATLEDLDRIERVIQTLPSAPPLINIKTRMIEVSDALAHSLAKEFSITNSATNGNYTVLTADQTAQLLKRCERVAGANILTTPEVTTISGRQAEVQMVDGQTIVTGIKTQALVYQTQNLPPGPVIGLLPYISADGYTIHLTAIPRVTEFMGYDQPKSGVQPLPRFRTRQLATQATLYDGQTLVLGGGLEVESVTQADGTTQTLPAKNFDRKQLLVLLTATVIDPAGNRFHPEDALPFAKNEIPKQNLH